MTAVTAPAGRPVDPPVMRLPLRSLIGFALVLGAAGAAADWSGTPVFQWQRCHAGWCETGWYASPAAGDVDGDGQIEVLWGGYRLMAVDGATGALEWTYAANPGSPSRLWPGIALADLDGDESLEIVTGNGAGQVAVLNGQGQAWSPAWPVAPFSGTPNPGGELRSLAVADLDRDGQKEILVARAFATGDYVWSVLEPDGNTRPGWPRHAPADAGYAWGAYNQNLAAGDLDGDGDLEVVASSDVHYLAAFEDDGSQIPAHSMYGDNKIWAQVGAHYHASVDLRGYAMCGAADPVLEPRPNFAYAAPLVADLDGDGTNEVVLIGNFYDCRQSPYEDLFELPIVLRGDRSRWVTSAFDWTGLPIPDSGALPLSEDYDVIESNQTNPVVADLDGDGRREILYPSYDGRLHAFWLDKTEHGSWPVDLNPVAAPLRFASEPAVADLDGDGKAEVIFTTWRQKGSNLPGELRIVSWQGTPIASLDLPAANGANWNGGLGAPTLANVDADPNLEVLIGTAHSGLVAYELPGTAGARLLWQTGRGDFARSAPEPGAETAALAAAVALGALARLRRTRG